MGRVEQLQGKGMGQDNLQCYVNVLLFIPERSEDAFRMNTVIALTLAGGIAVLCSAVAIHLQPVLFSFPPPCKMLC